MTRLEGNPHSHMASRLFGWGCWHRLLVGPGICRVPISIGGASTVLVTERHFGTKTHSSGADTSTSDGSEGSNYSTSEDRLFQLRKAEKVYVVPGEGARVDTASRLGYSVVYGVSNCTLNLCMFPCVRGTV